MPFYYSGHMLSERELMHAMDKYIEEEVVPLVAREQLTVIYARSFAGGNITAFSISTPRAIHGNWIV
jgi:hypothetical protein